MSTFPPIADYAEEIEASTGGHLGNVPQAFTHLALISQFRTDRGRGG